MLAISEFSHFRIYCSPLTLANFMDVKTLSFIAKVAKYDAMYALNNDKMYLFIS